MTCFTGDPCPRLACLGCCTSVLEYTCVCVCVCCVCMCVCWYAGCDTLRCPCGVPTVVWWPLGEVPLAVEPHPLPAVHCFMGCGGAPWALMGVVPPSIQRPLPSPTCASWIMLTSLAPSPMAAVTGASLLCFSRLTTCIQRNTQSVLQQIP